MAIDYDVVIIGGSLTGRYAAIAAIQLRARVALIEPEAQSLLARLAPHALTQLSQDATSGQGASMRWVEGVVSNIEYQYSLAVIAALGVDVIVGSGQFHRQPHLAFAVNGRFLRARAYLLATSTRSAIPDIAGLQPTGYLTTADICQGIVSTRQPPRNWVILGGDPDGCQLAQTLTRLGFKATVVVKRSHLLVKEDPDIAHLVQATLEAEGVRVLTQTPVTQVKQIQDKKWVQAGDEAIETDEILVAAGQVSNVESLNLEAVGVKSHPRGLQLNEKLQTTNPSIYACGDVNGDYQFVNIANYEARIALKNALFFPLFKADYRCIPWAIFSNPTLARVGLTETQARRRYPQDVLVLQQYFKTVAAAQLRNETTGVCKLVVRRNGEILGASILGAEAEELIQVVALAISQKLKVSAIAQLVPVFPSLAEILYQTAAAWSQQRPGTNRATQFLEDFFNFRRSWS